MEKVRILILVLCLSFQNLFGQQYYYWAYEEKHFLEIFPEKFFVLVDSKHGKESLSSILGVDTREISDMKNVVINFGMQRNSEDRTNYKTQLWTTVDSRFDPSLENHPEILYVTPYFKLNDKEIGLSHFFYVELNHEEDYGLLVNYAKENNVEIVGNDKYMPLWYVLSCSKKSNGNAMEMANKFHETKKFKNAQPDLMEDLLANCVDDTFFNEQWHLKNTGQSGGKVGSDIKICEAWQITMGCENIIVAVLDQGLELDHPDFNNIHPVSFDSENGTSPSIVRGSHGVPVAGIIGATANNNLGVAGV